MRLAKLHDWNSVTCIPFTDYYQDDRTKEYENHETYVGKMRTDFKMSVVNSE